MYTVLVSYFKISFNRPTRAGSRRKKIFRVAFELFARSRVDFEIGLIDSLRNSGSWDNLHKRLSQNLDAILRHWNLFTEMAGNDMIRTVFPL